MIQMAIYAGVVLSALLTLGLIITRLYRRAAKEIGFVRTGFGGEKVVINGGAPAGRRRSVGYGAGSSGGGSR